VIHSCLLVFHGYAESPAKPLDALFSAGLGERLLVAPMAPHHFYNRDGDVVASWMTRHRRELRIEELLEHARAVWDGVLERYGTPKLDVFGFSQGAAHAYRVALLADLPVESCFVLGGDLPPELRERSAGEKDPHFVLLSGDGDDRVGPERMELDARKLGERGYNVELRAFPGGHDYVPAALAEMRAILDQRDRGGDRKEVD